MMINTKKSIELAKKIYKKYGSWQNVRKNCEYIDGVYALKDDK